MRGRGGWTVAEAVVAMALAAAVLVVVAQVMSGTSHITRVQSQRSLQQTRLQAAAAQVEKALLASPSGAVSWQSRGDGAVLATHALDAACVVNVPRWAPCWRCFVWDAAHAQLVALQSPPPGGTPSPSQTRPQPMPSTELDGLLRDVVLGSSSGRVLASRVTDFRYALETGPTYRIEIEVDVPEYEKQEERAANRLRVVKLVHPRF